MARYRVQILDKEGRVIGESLELAHLLSCIAKETISVTFFAILDNYYEQRARGINVKLVDLATDAGVNYASLRQAKIRYDRRYKKE
jgi:hypothetical protein